LNSLFKNVVTLASGSLLTILIGVVSSKMFALLGGPPAIAEQGLIMSLMSLATMLAAFGLGSGVVRFGAPAITTNDLDQIAALRRAAWLVQTITWIVVSILMLIFYNQIGRWLLGKQNALLEVAVVALALGFMLSSALHTSVLNAYQRVKVLAGSNVIVALISSLAGVIVLWRFGVAGVVWGVLIGSVAGWLAVRFVVLREVGPVVKVPSEQVNAAAKTLLRFGGPFTLSLVFGQVVQQLLPSLILHELGRDEVGFYRVAGSFSVVYMGFLTNAMAQDYFPRLSALSSDSDVKEVMNQQHKLIMVLCLPVIFGLMWLAQIVVPLFYSSAFLPSVAVLEWQLVGSVLKLSSWVMSFVILARAGSGWFLLTEISAGVVSLFANLWAMRTFGISGLGIAFVITYAAYWLIVALVLRWRFKIGLNYLGLSWLGLGFAVSLIMLGSTKYLEPSFGFWFKGLCVLAVSVISLFTLRASLKYSQIKDRIIYF
jgi:O-antigen/teichoic acid export membrane protein